MYRGADIQRSCLFPFFAFGSVSISCLLMPAWAIIWHACPVKPTMNWAVWSLLCFCLNAISEKITSSEPVCWRYFQRQQRKLQLIVKSIQPRGWHSPSCVQSWPFAYSFRVFSSGEILVACLVQSVCFAHCPSLPLMLTSSKALPSWWGLSVGPSVEW